MCEDDAVALFSQRAAAVEPGVEDDASVTAICRRVDCLPLAIELAAARVGVLPPGARLERLERRIPVLGPAGRHAPERHRTLQATIAWSHDLLHPEKQRLLARVAVFAGGGTLDAAEDICDADLDTVGSLVDPAADCDPCRSSMRALGRRRSADTSTR
jgi:predicted ATPase